MNCTSITLVVAAALLAVGCGAVAPPGPKVEPPPVLGRTQSGAEELGGSTCGDCAPVLHPVVYRDTGVADAPDDLDLAARSDGQVAFAWVGVGEGVRGARVVRLDPQLHVLHSTGCIGPSSARSVALTALTRGWALTVAWYEGSTSFVDLYFVDEDGGATRRAQFENTHEAFFADREGGPLLVLTGRHASAVLLDTQARPVWERTVAGPTVGDEYASAAFTGESFLGGCREAGVTLIPVELDGTVGPRVSPVGSSTEYPQIIWTGSRALVTHAHFGGEAQLHALEVDARGNPLGPAVPIAEPRQYFNYSPGVSIGEGRAVVLLGGYTGGTGQSLPLDVGVFSGTSLAGPPSRLPDDPSAVRNYDIARAGSTIVVAWVGQAQPFRGPGRIFVARIR